MTTTQSTARRAQHARVCSTTFLLASAYAATAAIVLVAAVALVAGHGEAVETPVYLVAFLALMPLGLFASLKVEETQGDVRGVAVVDAAALALLLVTTRVADEAFLSSQATLGLLLAGAVAIAAVNVRAPAACDQLERVSTRLSSRGEALLVTASLVTGAIAFFPATFFTPARLWLALAFVAAVLAARRIFRERVLRRSARVSVDACVLLLIPLLVMDVGAYGDEHRYDYDFFLGPVAAIEHGHLLLVETFSQYGIGLHYALAAMFRILPLSYGGLQLVLGIGFVLEFLVVYTVLRAVCKSQRVAVGGLLIALAATLAAGGIAIQVPGEPTVPAYLPHIAYPSIGALRFGLPWAIVLGGVILARGGRHQPIGWTLLLGTLAVGAVWSIEMLVYCGGAYVGVCAARLAFEGGVARVRALAIELTLGFGAVCLGLASLTGLTRIASGSWPDWSTYLGLIALYAIEGFGALLVPRWSVGYLMAAFYVVSALGLAVIALRRVGSRWLPQLTVIGGATVYGAMAFSYFLGRSTTSNLHYIAIPAIVLVCCWWTILRPSLGDGRVALAAVATIAWLGGSLLVHNSPTIVKWLEATPLTETFRSPRLVVSKTRMLLDEEEPRPSIAEGAHLLARHATRDADPAVLIRADRLTSTLLASRHGNALPIVNGHQDRLTGEPALKIVSGAADRLPLETIVLTETMFLRRSPSSFAGTGNPEAGDIRYGDYFIARALGEVRRRFHLRVLERGAHGLIALEISRRK